MMRVLSSVIIFIILSLVLLLCACTDNTDEKATTPASSSIEITADEPTSSSSEITADEPSSSEITADEPASASSEITADEPSSSEITESAPATTADTKDVPAPSDSTFSIYTPFAVLKYPQKWQDKVQINVADDRISFTADGTPLFDLLINSDEGFILGTLIGKDEDVFINFLEYEVEDDELAKMQEDVNVILQNLIDDYEFIPGEKVDNAVFPIETSVTTLYYPAKWQYSVSINVYDGGVNFSYGETKLFDIVFSECDGYQLGTYNGTPIYVVDYVLTDDMLVEMQEDINVILDHLMKDEAFSVS